MISKKAILSFVAFILGYGLIWYSAGWMIAVGVWCIHLSINLEQEIKRTFNNNSL